jgi:hypothetical protein
MKLLWSLCNGRPCYLGITCWTLGVLFFLWWWVYWWNFLLSADQVLGLNWQPIFDHLKTSNSKSFTTSLLQITPSHDYVSIKRSNDWCNAFFWENLVLKSSVLNKVGEKKKKFKYPMGCILAKILEMGGISRILWARETICYMGFLQSMCQQMKKVRSWVYWIRVPNNVHRSISNIQLTCFQNPRMYIEASRTFKLHVSKSILYIPYSLPKIRYIMKK